MGDVRDDLRSGNAEEVEQWLVSNVLEVMYLVIVPVRGGRLRVPAPYYLAGRGWGAISSSDGRDDTLRVSIATAPLTDKKNIYRCAYLKPAATAAKEPLEPLP